MSKIKKGDDVIVIAGKDKGRRGAVIKVPDPGHVIIENLNMSKKHTRPNPNAGATGGIIEREMPLHISNVMLYNPVSKKGDRAGFRRLENGRKVRIYRSNKEVVDI
ncbi:MAG: 50S ribosomal protein L24 [Gammaproteobacteria bacterium]